ncbi:MAG: ABC transporter ATP-binding protein [Anaerolineaceae bacterium]
MTDCIELKNLSKDYGDGRGIFDISFTVKKGETYGFVGTNGAGKTTTIRHIMGFLKAASGTATINSLDCWKRADEVKKSIGYIPGEISFPEADTGEDFLRIQASFLGLTDMSRANYIIEKLQLDPTANLQRMSKGMKQKTAIVAGFMNDPDILILDEPSTGLDPLMRVAFVELLNEEKQRGKTIFMSSHMFDEVEDTCDRVAFIKAGKIIAETTTSAIKYHTEKKFKIEFLIKEDYEQFKHEDIAIVEDRGDQLQVVVSINDRNINIFMNVLKKYQIKFITEIKYALEDYFKTYYN